MILRAKVRWNLHNIIIYYNYSTWRKEGFYQLPSAYLGCSDNMQKATSFFRFQQTDKCHPRLCFCRCKSAVTWIAQLHITGKLAFHPNLDRSLLSLHGLIQVTASSHCSNKTQSDASCSVRPDRPASLNALDVLSKRVLKLGKGDQGITWLHVTLYYLIQVSAQSLFTRLQLQKKKKSFILLEWPSCLG